MIGMEKRKRKEERGGGGKLKRDRVCDCVPIGQVTKKNLNRRLLLESLLIYFPGVFSKRPNKERGTCFLADLQRNGERLETVRQWSTLMHVNFESDTKNVKKTVSA